MIVLCLDQENQGQREGMEVRGLCVDSEGKALFS